MQSIDAIRTLLPLVNVKSIILDPPGQIGDSLSLKNSVFFGRGPSLNVQVKTTSITTANNETIDAQNIFSSIPNFNFNDHLRVCIIQSRSPDLTNILKSMGDAIIKYIGPTDQWRGNSQFTDKIHSNIAGLKQSDVGRFKNEFMKIQTKKLFESVDMPLLEKVDDAGHKIRSVPLNFNFTLETDNPTHLSYFVIPYVDLQSLIETINGIGNWSQSECVLGNIGLNLTDFVTLGSFTTPLNYDIIFDQGKLSGDSFFYKTQSGNIWTGPVHRMPNGTYMSGNTHTPSSKYLNVIRTNNVKVQDFRTQRGIQSVGVMSDFQDEAATVNNILRNLQPKNRDLNPGNDFTNSYVSELFLSTGTRKSGKFMFLINMDALVSANSLYGKLVKTGRLSLRDEIFDRSPIKSFKVYRQTVREVIGNNSLGAPVRKFLEQDESPVLVASTFQKDGSTSLISTGDINEETKMSFSDVGVRAFNVVDRNFSPADKSQYQYRVEMEITDKTLIYFREQVIRLRRFINTLENFESDMINATVRTPQDRKNSPIKENSRSMVRTRTVGGYDERFGNLTPGFADKMLEKYGSDISAGIGVFIKLLKIFSNDEDFNPDQETNLSNYLGLLTSPHSTNPTNVSSLVRLMQDSTSKINTFIGQNTRETDPTEKKPYAGYAHGETIQVTPGEIRVEKKFNNILDLSQHGKGGYDYLSENTGESNQDSSNQTGLRLLGGKKYRYRVVKEILKFFLNSDPDLTNGLASGGINYAGGDSAQSTGFSFFSPGIIKFNEISIDTLNNRRIDNPLLTGFIESKLISNAATSEVSGDEPPYDNSFRQNSFLAAQGNVNAQQIAPPEQQNFLSQNYSLISTPTQKIIPLAESRTSGPSIPPLEPEETPGGSAISPTQLPSMYPASFMERIFKRAIHKGTEQVSNTPVSNQQNIDLFNLSDPGNFLSGIEQSKVASLPNQIKALFISTTTGNGGDVIFRPLERRDVFNDPDYASTATLKYKLLVQVEFLDTFAVQSVNHREKLLMSAPNWSRLTPDAFSQFVGKKILCRLRKYEIPEWGIARPPLLDALVYDEHFIVQPDTALAGADPTATAGRADFTAAGWGLTDEEYAMLSEFGTSYMPALNEQLASVELARIATEMSAFAEVIVEDPIVDQFVPPNPLATPSGRMARLAELREKLKAIDVVIAGMESAKDSKITLSETLNNDLSKEIAALNGLPAGSSADLAAEHRANIGEFNHSVDAVGSALAQLEMDIEAKKIERVGILSEIKEANEQLTSGLIAEQFGEGGQYGANCRDSEQIDALEEASHNTTEAVVGSLEYEIGLLGLTGDAPTPAQMGRFNDFKSWMSEGDAENFEALLAELEAMGPTGIQLANDMRTQVSTIFNTAMDACEWAPGEQELRRVIEERQLTEYQRVPEFIKGIVEDTVLPWINNRASHDIREVVRTWDGTPSRHFNPFIDEGGD